MKRYALVVAVAVLGAACGDSPTDPSEGPVVFTSSLAASNEVPPVTNADRDAWKVYSPHQLKASLGHSFLHDRLVVTLAAALYGKVDDPTWAAGQHHRLLVNAAVRHSLNRQVYVKLVVQNLSGNTVPAARIDNGVTQVGNLGIERRLIYLSLGLLLR